MKVRIPFLEWTSKTALEIEIGDDVEERFRLWAALEIAVKREADLRGADLEGAYLGGASAVIALGQPDGWWAYTYVYSGELMFRIGCQTKSLADAREYWNETHEYWLKRKEVAACIEYAVTVAKLRGWEFKE